MEKKTVIHSPHYSDTVKELRKRITNIQNGEIGSFVYGYDGLVLDISFVEHIVDETYKVTKEELFEHFKHPLIQDMLNLILSELDLDYTVSRIKPHVWFLGDSGKWGAMAISGKMENYLDEFNPNTNIVH